MASRTFSGGTMRVFKEAWGRRGIIFEPQRVRSALQTLLLSPAGRVPLIVISELFEMHGVPLGKLLAMRT
jgi:hypothetical protein